MDELLQWSELIAYMTASLAAFIYICDTSFIYFSGVKKYLRAKNKEKQKLKEDFISASLNGSRESTPNASMIFPRVSQHPQFRRNYAIGRNFVQSPLPLRETIVDMEPTRHPNENKTLFERSTINPIFNSLQNNNQTPKNTNQIINFNDYSESDEISTPELSQSSSRNSPFNNINNTNNYHGTYPIKRKNRQSKSNSLSDLSLSLSSSDGDSEN